MDYAIILGGFLLLFVVIFFATGVLGRGWFLWPKDEAEGKPRR